MHQNIGQVFLVVGSGGREHAIVTKLLESKRVAKPVLCWPAHPVLESYTEVKVLRGSLDNVLSEHNVDVVVVGPEQYLEDGLADLLKEKNIACFGPLQAAARLETSKAFAKDLMSEAKIPTASFEVFQNKQQAFVHACEFLPKTVVIKASGLAAGKGVFLCDSKKEIESALDKVFGDIGSKEVVIEECLQGPESSFFLAIGFDADHPQNCRLSSLGFVADYKRRGEGNTGPNTGGMGGYTPLDWLPTDAEEQVMSKVIVPLLACLKTRQLSYHGFLYVGLMWVDQKPFVIEFNVRLGDPEAQILSQAYDADWGQLILYHLGKCESFDNAVLKPTVGVVMTGEYYPDSAPEHAKRENLSAFTGNKSGAKIYFASVEHVGNELFSSQGRVLCVVSSGVDLEGARQAVYGKVKSIHAACPSLYYRRDIAEE